MTPVLKIIENGLADFARSSEELIEKSTVGALYDATYLIYKETKKALSAGTLGLPERVAFRGIRQARREIKATGANVKLRSGARAKIPLRGLSPGVIYKVFKSEKRAEIGFIGQEAGAARIAQWAEEMAGQHAPGYTILYDKELRGRLHAMGIHLKKTTTSAAVPGRSIMDMAAAKLGAAALGKLRDSFDRKMAGERT